MSNRKNVPASEVREWLTSEAGAKAIAAAVAKDDTIPTKVGTRGRPHPAHVALFHKANPRKRYEVGGEAEKPTITVPVAMLDSIGRKTTRQVTVTTAEARDLLGQAGRKGRFARGDLSLALEAKFLADAGL